MRIQFSLQAQSQLEMLLSLPFRGSGLLLGESLGKYVLVESLWPFSLTEKRLPKVVAHASRKFQERLRGVFFLNRPVILHSSLLEEIVLHHERGSARWAVCRWDAGISRPKLDWLPSNQEDE